MRLPLFFQRKKSVASEIKGREEKRADIDDTVNIINAMPDPILIVDRSRVIRHVNNAAQRLFDRALTGRNIVQCIRQPHVINAIEKVFETLSDWHGEARFPAPVEHYLSIHIAPIKNGVGVVVTLRDTTLVKRTEEMHSDFVANVSHELRSPLSAIVGFIETIKGPARDDTEARERFLDIMVQEASRMTRLIDDLLSLSRVQIQEHVVPSDQVNISQTLKAIIDISTIKAQARDVNLKLQLPNDDLFVLGETDQITQVFQNLIDNAIKYGRSDSDVTIRCALIDRMPDRSVPGVMVSVRDQGDGIEEEHIPRLTERFYRIDKARSRTMGGTGLGLAIVKHIIMRHRGRLKIESTLGVGSTFTVTLPSAK